MQSCAAPVGGLEELHGQGPVHCVLLGQVEDRLSRAVPAVRGAVACAARCVPPFTLRLVQLEEVFSSQRLWRIRFLQYTSQSTPIITSREMSFRMSFSTCCRYSIRSSENDGPAGHTRSSSSPARSLRRIPSASSGAASAVEPTAAGQEMPPFGCSRCGHLLALGTGSLAVTFHVHLHRIASHCICITLALRQSLLFAGTIGLTRAKRGAPRAYPRSGHGSHRYRGCHRPRGSQVLLGRSSVLLQRERRDVRAPPVSGPRAAQRARRAGRPLALPSHRSPRQPALGLALPSQASAFAATARASNWADGGIV